MEKRKIGDMELSRFSVATKRLPMQDASRVDRLDRDVAREVLDAADELGANLVVTSYSDAKGETEGFLGQMREERARAGGDALAPMHVATSFFELVDPRFSYVFQKQLKKLRTDCIDLYFVEGVCDLTRMRDIDSGAVDFLFEQKAQGKIGALGFSSELSAEHLADYLGRYPWDFVRMKVNYHDWFTRGGRECYQAAVEAGVPILAHAPLRCGASSNLKPQALQILREAAPDRSSIEWALLFVKSLEAVVSTSCNVRSAKELAEDAAAFTGDATLGDAGMDVLEACAAAQQTRKGA